MTVLCMLIISLLSHRYVYFKCVYVWIKQKAKTKKTSSGNSTSQISEYLPQFLILIILKDFSHKTLNKITGFSMIMDLKSDSHLPKKLHYLLHWKPSKNNEECFLFHFKNVLCSQDISVFIMTFQSCRKNCLIRKIRLTSKFMTSQPG